MDFFQKMAKMANMPYMEICKLTMLINIHKPLALFLRVSLVGKELPLCVTCMGSNMCHFKYGDMDFWPSRPRKHSGPLPWQWGLGGNLNVISESYSPRGISTQNMKGG